MSGRASEWLAGRYTRGRVVFTSTRRRLTSMAVRGDQMAQEMGGISIRHRYLTDRTVAASPCVVWVVEPDLAQVTAFGRLTPQVFDVVNPAYAANRERFYAECRAFDYFILNTASSRFYLGPERETEYRWWVIPHHHCNGSGWRLPEGRLERPRVVGYVGQPEHLHDAGAVADRVRQLGLEFRMFETTDLAAYSRIDIGVAWTRPEEQRDQTRSNIKLVNFGAHGIPCVVSDYESYRDVNRAVGEVGVVRQSLPEFLDALAELATEEGRRRELASRTGVVQTDYSRAGIARQYWEMIEEIGQRS